MFSYSVSDANRILIDAAHYGDLERFDFALANGADITRFTEPNPSHSSSHTPVLVGKAGLAAALQGGDEIILTDERIAIVRKLLNMGVTVNVPIDASHSPLSLAAHSGHQELVDLLLQHGAKLFATGKNRKHLLFMAFYKRVFAFAEIQLEYLVNLPRDEQLALELEDALYMAAKFGQRKCVEILLENGVSANAREVTVRGLGGRALMAAVSEGHGEIVTLLRAHGGDLWAERDNGTIALLSAASGGLTELVLELFESGCDVNAKGIVGITALGEAAGRGHDALARILIDKGADIHANNKATLLGSAATGNLLWLAQACLDAEPSREKHALWCTQALKSAVCNGHIAMMQFLVEHGANLNYVRDTDGNTPLHHAIYSHQTQAAQWLIENGANINAVAENPVDGDYTPLLNAIIHEQTEIVRALIAAGVDVNFHETIGIGAALNYASSEDNVEIVALLLQAGANVNFSESTKWTPLRIAAQSGQARIVKLLLAAGADRNAVNTKGQTALDLAIYEGFPRVIELLQQ